MNQLRAGVLLTYATILVTNSTGLFFTPYLLNKLGQADYGLYALVGSLMGYLGLLAFGMGGTLIRYVARYRASGETGKIENLFFMGLFVHIVLGVLVLIFGFILWINLPILLSKLPATELEKARTMLTILVVGTAISFPGIVFFTIQEAFEQFMFSRTWNLVRYLLRVVAVFILLSIGYKVVAIVVVDAALSIISLVINVVFVLGVMKVRIRFHSFDISLLKEVFIFAFWFFLSMIVTQLYWSFGQAILGITQGTSSVAIFAISVQISGYFLALSAATSGVFTPRAAIMDVQNADDEAMTDMMIKIGRYLLLIIGLVYIGFFCFGRMFINNWLGVDYEEVWGQTIIMITPLIVVLTQSFGISILQAKNKIKVRALLLLCVVGFSSVVGYYLTLKWGGVGAALGTSLGLVTGSGIAINIYYHFFVGLDITRFFREVWYESAFPLLICMFTGLCIDALIPGNGWVPLLWRVILLSAFYMCVMWLFGTRKEERAIFLSLLPNKCRLASMSNRKVNGG